MMIGSRVARQTSISSFGAVVPRVAVVVALVAVGLGLDERRASPARARTIASPAAAYTATDVQPSTITPGIP